MKTHPYLRAYMAGITLPTMFLLIIMTFFTIARHVYHLPIPLERIIVFPMAIVPNLWGVWNVLYLLLQSRYRLAIGLHGAVLPFIIAPLAYGITRVVDFTIPAFCFVAFPFAFPVVVVIFYLLWKYFVRFFNELMGLA